MIDFICFDYTCCTTPDIPNDCGEWSDLAFAPFATWNPSVTYDFYYGSKAKISPDGYVGWLCYMNQTLYYQTIGTASTPGEAPIQQPKVFNKYWWKDIWKKKFIILLIVFLEKFMW